MAEGSATAPASDTLPGSGAATNGFSKASGPSTTNIKATAVYFGPRLRGLWRFTDLYYIANLLLLLTYPFARFYVIHVAQFAYKRLIFNELELWDWEKHALQLLGVVMAVKGWKALSMDSLFADFFLYTKSIVLAITYAIDLRIFVYYVIAVLVLFMIAQQPCYTGPDKIKYFTPGTFKWEVQETHKGVTWLVELYAPWSPLCIHLEPVFADLSLKYATDKLKFGKLDLGRWPAIASELKIDVSGATQQLPTIIMYEKGEEVGRIPHVFSDGSFAKGKFRRSDIVRAFDLDGQHSRTAAATPATGSDASKKDKKNK
mmetsp:Transcript_37002/g.104458  ORF Transcript_37002/g.104458 Transcript_37002/m.104458 type:complete len:316 (+) Transcript_37002:263-1210(+)|eukprot:CAMPEP_0117660676 /NCGR_PEP_ID=MMETSP0804-20121206/7092_1 /TAXON_ID=1074897 /ORGANISM="Tetraselmis astigmatica, Strain CCMP880" /LENGTH=315 /DNA_ID=CAMNT_0005467415 /DNA_START=201 /DNA_END=1148 /DNA_ORIENTATION=-